jgi:hypothetical protein
MAALSMAPQLRLGMLQGKIREEWTWPHLNPHPVPRPAAPARRTVDTDEQWLRRFLRFHLLRHPQEMGSVEVNAFLTHLAVEGQVCASTQNQA